jgi:hypothetical protein
MPKGYPASGVNIPRRRKGWQRDAAFIRLLAVTKLVYDTKGPKRRLGRRIVTLSARAYAAKKRNEAAEEWDFEDRILMHELATAITKAEDSMPPAMKKKVNQ